MWLNINHKPYAVGILCCGFDTCFATNTWNVGCWYAGMLGCWDANHISHLDCRQAHAHTHAQTRHAHTRHFEKGEQLGTMGSDVTMCALLAALIVVDDHELDGVYAVVPTPPPWRTVAFANATLSTLYGGMCMVTTPGNSNDPRSRHSAGVEQADCCGARLARAGWGMPVCPPR